MRLTPWMVFAASLAAALTLATPALAADGDLDPTFGGDGFAQAGRESFNPSIARQQADGKVLIAGRSPNASGGYVARLHPNGDVDLSFGTGVGGSIPVDADVREVATIDGKIYVVGTTQQAGQEDAVVYRFNSNGDPDTSFSGDGKLAFDYDAASAASTGAGLAIQPNRRIVVTGRSGGFGGDIAAARININGSFDSSFGGDGRVRETLSDASEGDRVVLQGSRIILVGTLVPFDDSGFSRRFAVVALTSSGARDNSFGPSGNGTFISGYGETHDPSNAVLAPDGGVVVVGDQRDFQGMPVVKLTREGRPDTAFSGDGLQYVTWPGDGSVRGGAVTVTRDGNYVVGGGVFTDSGHRMALAKLAPSGDLVTSFGDGGMRLYDRESDVTDLERQPDGKLLAGLSDGNDLRSMAVARVQDSGSTPPQPPVFLELTGGQPASEGRIATFRATLSRATDQPVTFSYVTGEGSAASNLDFGGRSGKLTIPAGSRVATIGIPTNSDRLFENDESFRVELSGVSGARVGEYVAFGTIVNVLRSGRCQNIVKGRKGTDILTGSRAGDLIIGRQDIDFLFGLGGADCIRGERGGDIIDAGDGDDVVDGGTGNDRIRGGDGDDRLYGRRGRNRYNGGPGNDLIVSRNGVAETVECGPGRDRVRADRKDRLRRCEFRLR